MLKLNRASKPFYFILEPCTTSITIDRQRIIVWGGKVNHEYFSHVRRRGRLIALVDSVRASYARSLADSTLTPGREAWLLKRNDRLHNSLQAMTLHLVKRTDVVGHCIATSMVPIWIRLITCNCSSSVDGLLSTCSTHKTTKTLAT